MFYRGSKYNPLFGRRHVERAEERRGKEMSQQAETKEERKGPPCRPQDVVLETEQVSK